MIGSLPKLLDKNFAIGFFVPALLAVLAIAWTFPNLTVLDPVRTLGVSDKSLTDLTYVVLIVWTIAILLMTANHALYRILEGYLPPVSWMRPLLWWHRWRFNRLKGQYDKLINQWQTAIDCNQKFPQEHQNQVSAFRRKLLSRYPISQTELMPTRFGNIIRAFEVYPREVYGVDSVPVWLRLASVIPKDFVGLLDDARAQADFFVNLMYLALLIAIASSVDAIYKLNWQQIFTWDPLGSGSFRHVVFVLVTALAVSVVSYCWATTRVTAWGDLVRSAFDCYLPALMKQLGFAVPPTDAKRREFWAEFSALITYQQQMTTDWALARDEAGSPKEEHKSDKTVSENNAAEMETTCGPEDNCSRGVVEAEVTEHK